MSATLTIGSMLQRTVERHPDRDAVIYQGRRWTYAEWNSRVNRVAAAMAEIGIRPFDRIALLLPTSEVAATLYFACQKLGAVAVPMNFRLAPAEVAHILRDSGARLLAYGGPQTETALRAADEFHDLAALVVAELGDEDAPDGSYPFRELLESGTDVEPSTEVTPEMLSALVYTSGTTGRPKGVMHSHLNDVSVAMNCAMEYHLGADDRALHVAPLYHVGGMQAFFVPHLLVGGANVIERRYDPVRTLEAIQEHGITTLFAVPTQIQQVLFTPTLSSYDTSSLRMITSGGAALPAAVMERVLEELCPRLFNGYGMTEASLTLLLNSRDSLRKIGSCGKSTLISETRILVNDPDRDVPPEEVAPRGAVGQLIVRGPQLTSGYWNNAAETAKRIRNGWLYTGDLFSCDDEGYHYFQGRADDMIVSGGENIYPSEVEEVLYRCPGVREAAVVGLPDPNWGSAVAAFVVRADPELTASAIDEFCRTSGLLAAFKRPRRIQFLDALPLNPSGKVLKHQLVDAHTS